ncbi:MAG: hypothetical protein HY721_26120 [Planctomycetes bacterium]|nr:hypothetical protein [Planctomycetota bacterium]
MPYRRSLRIALGAALWAAGLVAAGTPLLSDRGAGGRGAGGSTAARLAGFLAREEARLRIAFAQPVYLEVGDDVEVGGAVAGEVEALLGEGGEPVPSIYGWTRWARLRLYDGRGAALRRGASARLVRVPQTAAWVVQTLFTRETIPRVAEEWNRTMLEHREEIFALLTPIVRDLILDVERHVEAELPGFLEAHRAEVSDLGDRLKQDFGPKRFADLFEEEVWPIARPLLRPIVEKVSREIWEKLPLWGLTWRLAYQKLPLTDNDHLDRAWVTFLEGQALPVILAHTDEILAAARQVTREALSRDHVSASLRGLFSRLLAEPRFHALCQAFLRELFLDNGRFHDVLLQRWRSPEVQRAVEAAAAHVEPMVRRMGDIVLGTREAGITREFARVLRSQILLKDLQRIAIDPGPEGAPPLEPGAVLEARVEWEHARR